MGLSKGSMGAKVCRRRRSAEMSRIGSNGGGVGLVLVVVKLCKDVFVDRIVVSRFLFDTLLTRTRAPSLTRRNTTANISTVAAAATTSQTNTAASVTMTLKRVCGNLIMLFLSVFLCVAYRCC